MFRLLLKAVPLFTAVCLPLSSACAQEENQSGRQFGIDSVTATFESTPKFPGPSGKNSRMRTSWMQIEVTFNWQNKARAGADGEPLTEFLDELEVGVYALLATRVSAKEQAALLTGETTLVHVPQDRNLTAAVYVSPRLMDQIFNGKAPSTPNGALVSKDTLGAVLKYQGEVVATFPVLRPGQTPFWEDTTIVRLPKDAVRTLDGGILPRWQTPFAFSNWDFYQQEKGSD
jgi:hypothetical protein